jgi:hypothetical protein
MGSDIYVGGAFDSAGGIAASNIARWDGSGWHAVGSGLNAPVHALAFRNDTLYAGGEFTSAGDILAPHIARWDGTSWSTLGDGVTNDVDAIAIADGAIYAGGSFSGAGGTDALCIARWDIPHGTWSPLGSGITGGNNPTVKALAVRNNELYVGGDFTTAGNRPSLNIARWLAPTLSVGEENGERDMVKGDALRLGRSRPNPASATAAISFRLPRSSFSTLKIYDARGREVATLLNGEMAAGDHNVRWPVDGVADGIYFYRLNSGGSVETGEMVVLH